MGAHVPVGGCAVVVVPFNQHKNIIALFKLINIKELLAATGEFDEKPKLPASPV